MAQPYQQLRDPTNPQQISETVLRVEDNAHIPNDPAATWTSSFRRSSAAF